MCEEISDHQTGTSLLVPFLKPILDTLMFAHQKYQARSLLILYDAIGALCEAVGDQLAHPELSSVLIPPLLTKWQSIEDTDRQLFPLNECLAAVAKALGLAFQEYSLVVFQRCCHQIQSNLLAHATGMAMPNGDPYDKDFMVCAIDLLSGLCEGLKGNFGTLAHGSKLLELLHQVRALEKGLGGRVWVGWLGSGLSLNNPDHAVGVWNEHCPTTLAILTVRYPPPLPTPRIISA